ncbi:MAG: aldehyde dehydrogenase family protein [Bacteroidetes bacterium]|nr:aldehyde dehydrogenase family protein [Bacteroidota bacterium]
MELSADLRSIQQARDFLETASKAQQIYKEFTQEQVDKIVKAMAEAGEAASEKLAKLAVENTKMGRYEDKILKNKFGSRTVYESIKDLKTVGIVHKSADGKVWEVAEPMGVIAALIPTTNPTSTALYKAIIALKSRNSIVMAPHPKAIQCTLEAVNVVRDAAERAGAPKGLIHCMTEVSIVGTEELMRHKLTNVILATGSSAMVKAAQSTGKPAYGVGSGNVPSYVDRTAKLDKAIRDIISSCSFDNGTLCSTERSIIVDAPVKAQVLDLLKKYKAAFLSPEDTKKLEKYAVPGGKLNPDVVGQPAVKIAQGAGISLPADTRVLVAEIQKVGKEDPLSMETLSPILSFFTVNGWQEGCERSMQILNFGGIGHTMSLHSSDEKVITEFALKKPAMRIVVNSMSSLGAVGFTTNLPPALTLGCGTWGGSITADNITPVHLLNIKRIAFETREYTANWMGTSSTKPISANEEKTVSKVKRPEPYLTPYKSKVSKEPVEVKSTQSQPVSSPVRTSEPVHSWIEEIEDRIRSKAGNVHPPKEEKPVAKPEIRTEAKPVKVTESLPISDESISNLIKKFSKS